MFGLILFFTLAALLAFLVWASASIASGVYVKAFCRVRKSTQPWIALTFDDGPAGTGTEEVLDVLKRHGACASFFLIGSQAEKYPMTVRRMLKEGHVIGSHTYSHRPDFPLSGHDKVMEELMKNREQLCRITGKKVRLFRPPFGVTNPVIGRAVKMSGMDCVGWSVRSFDTVKTRSRERILEKISRRLRPGEVILLHDRCDGAADLLEEILQMIEKKGYKTVTVDKLFNLEAYEI